LGSTGGNMDERLLTVDEAAALLQTTTDHLYRHWKELPFAFKLSPRQPRFSLRGIHHYIEEQQHAGTGLQTE
jgi:hypothetical protein